MSKQTAQEKTFPLSNSASLLRVRTLSDRGATRLQRAFASLSLLFFLAGFLLGGAAACVNVPCSESSYVGEGMAHVERYMNNPRHGKALTFESCSIF